MTKPTAPNADEAAQFGKLGLSALAGKEPMRAGEVYCA